MQIRALWVLQQMILQRRMCSTAVQLFRNNHRKPLREEIAFVCVVPAIETAFLTVSM